MRKICVVTGTRAEYGLLYWLMRKIQSDVDMELQIIVTGMHLSPEFGLTYKDIEKEFPANKKIEMLLSSDTPVGISKSMGIAQMSFAEAYAELRPDVVVVLGDRFEIFSAVVAAMVARIPIAHIHGGELTEGAIDEPMRHAITKMSHLHFAATSEYRKRIIQLGENPERVFNVGAVGLDNVCNLKLLSKEDFEKSIGFRLNAKNFLVTFHPVTLEEKTAEYQFRQLISALDVIKDAHFIFTKANSDADGRIINTVLDEYVAANQDKAVAFISLGQLRYLSAMQYVNAVIGNSSSGLIEAPSFGIGTINIGDRQKGRIRAESVIDCSPDAASITESLRILDAPQFQRKLKGVKNPYGSCGASKTIHDILATVDLEKIIFKSFYDVRFNP